MTLTRSDEILSQDRCEQLFPHDLADRFFEALYGDTEEGAYDIRLKFKGQKQDRLEFEFQLKQRPGKCLACNLTYGLPNVFSRHPVFAPQSRMHWRVLPPTQIVRCRRT